ncbi:MAG: hydroxyacid dehydrogenase, partial [Nitrospinae bacterium CG11_big_fil_rev_8_21_14_0_20_56_8]
MDVMFYEAFQEEVAALKLFLPKDVDAGFTEKTIQESEDRDPPAGLISIRTQSVIPVEWSTKMSGVLTRSTGYDHIVAYREKIKAPVLAGYLPRYCSRAVAEHVVLMMMSLLRRFKEQISHFGAFNRNGITGEECFGKNLLVVGVGHIGGQVADIGKGLRMNVRGVDIAHKNIELEYTS